MGRASDVLTALPNRVRRDIEKLSRKTGETCDQIVESGIRLYKKELADKAKLGNIVSKDLTLAAMKADPEHRESLRLVMATIAREANHVLTDKERQDRSRKGGIASSKRLTKEQRTKRAKKAAEKRWKG